MPGLPAAYRRYYQCCSRVAFIALPHPIAAGGQRFRVGSINLKIPAPCFPFYAQVALGADTELLFMLISLPVTNLLHMRVRYHWQDGSTGQQFHGPWPGIYWLDVTNWCGHGKGNSLIFSPNAWL